MPTTPRAQNGWPGLTNGHPLLHEWLIPARTGHIRIRLRNGSAGFILCHFLLWFAEAVEPLRGKVMDDWGHAWRNVRAGSDLSNHAAGCAADHNATQHVLGKAGTFTQRQAAAIRLRIRWVIYAGVLRHGIDYHGRKDEMHVEIVGSLRACERVAKRLARTRRGRRLLGANPGQRAVIWS